MNGIQQRELDPFLETSEKIKSTIDAWFSQIQDIIKKIMVAQNTNISQEIEMADSFTGGTHLNKEVNKENK